MIYLTVKIEARRMDLHLERFKLQDMLNDVINTVQPLVTTSAMSCLTSSPGLQYHAGFSR